MAYTLGEAAKATGKSKTTIKRALEKGRISGAKSDTGEWQIEPVELHRVYPKVEHGTVTEGTADSTPRNTEFQIRIEAAERENALLRSQLEDVKQDRDHWRQQAERTTNLLTDQRQSPEPKVVHHFLPWWQRFWKPGTP